MSGGDPHATRATRSTTTLLALAVLFGALAALNAVEFVGALRTRSAGVTGGDWFDLALALLLATTSLWHWRAWWLGRRA